MRRRESRYPLSPTELHGETHGGKISVEYRTWASIKRRCYNPKAQNYTRYGGKGIRLCRRWWQFSNFLLDMGRRPSAKHSIERRRNDRGYSPKNCYWATPEQQAQNRSSVRQATLMGKTWPAVRWARYLKISEKRVLMRLYLGWTPSEALLLPMSQRLRRPEQDKKTIRAALILLRAGAIDALRERPTQHWTTYARQREILCAVCTRVLPGADNLCIHCHHSLHQHMRVDSTGYGCIRWAASRARRYALRGKR